MHLLQVCVCACACLCMCQKCSHVDGSVPAVQDPDNNLASSSSEFIAPWYVCYSVTVCPSSHCYSSVNQ